MRLLVLALLVRVFGTAGHEPKCGAGGGGYNEDDEELAVRRLYEAAPYPPRLHGRHQEGHRVLVECLPDVVNAALPELSLFAEARFSRQRPLRILVAGGGTGDPTLACAHSFHLAEIHVHIVHLDLSARSTNIARQRVGNLLERSLADRITFVRGSIAAVAVAAAASQSNSKRSQNYWHSTTGEDLDANNPRHASDIKALFAQPFDYIHSTGVLHHSRSPEQSLRLLTSLLHQDGGMALWVYASPGRDGVHDCSIARPTCCSSQADWHTLTQATVWGS